MARSLALALLVGCATPFPIDQAPPGASEAIALAWTMQGGQGAPPVIEWKSGACAGHPCREGVYYPGSDTIEIVPNETWRSTLWHELHHAYLEHSTGDLDPNHLRPEWSAEYPAGDYLRAMNP